MYFKLSVFITLSVLGVITTVSTLQCVDSTINGNKNCTNGDVCFRVVDNTTQHRVTQGCGMKQVCKNIKDGSNCTTCFTDLCNTGSRMDSLPMTIAAAATIMFLVFSRWSC